MRSLKTLLYMGVTHGAFTFYLPYRLASIDRLLFQTGIFHYLAIPASLLGALIIVQSSVEIVRNGFGTPAHFDAPKKLIVVGLYHYVRNPIYLGALFVVLGDILWFGSRMAFLYFLLYILGFHLLIVLIEEPILRRTFGSEYEEYCKSVPRWIPRMMK
ncbi:MAG: isoprenylcysteine carboxylmethyltransferase family protein [Chloroflexi bacterium]|nr:isoprenylcysteine carboxylmethyltransferase family protein [Chloroflexota bacterium]MBI3168287.1 isoprenylcysteine carboxylmethyltransferase family protein [Chloroflexota bacterium]